MPNHPGGFFDLHRQHWVFQGMVVRTMRKPSHISAGVQIEHDMHTRPDELPDEGGDSMSDSSQCRIDASAFNERSIHVDAVVQLAFARARATGRWIQHRQRKKIRPRTSSCRISRVNFFRTTGPSYSLP